MIANSSVKFALVPLLIMAATWTSPFRLGQIRANRLTLTPVLGSSQSGIEPKVIEQRDFSGKVAARLRITPGPSPGEFHFEVEDFKQPIPARAIGSGKISDTGVRVQIVERASRTQLGFRATVNGGRSFETQIAVSLDRLSFKFVMDERVRMLINDAQRLIASGASDADLIRVAQELDNALQIRTGHRPFSEQVRNSAAFDILTTIRSLIATVPREEVKQNLALVAIRDIFRFIAPRYEPTSSSAVQVREIAQGIVKTAYNSGSKSYLAQMACFYPNSCPDWWFNCCIPIVCGPLPILLEMLCDTACMVEWLFCLP